MLSFLELTSDKFACRWLFWNASEHDVIKMRFPIDIEQKLAFGSEKSIYGTAMRLLCLMVKKKGSWNSDHINNLFGIDNVKNAVAGGRLTILQVRPTDMEKMTGKEEVDKYLYMWVPIFSKAAEENALTDLWVNIVGNDKGYVS